jgi:hypothetical protein
MSTDATAHRVPTYTENIVSPGGFMSRSWYRFFQALASPAIYPASTVANLPATTVAGDRSFVTDATSITFRATAVGGGTYNVPVFYDGKAWRVG